LYSVEVSFKSVDDDASKLSQPLNLTASCSCRHCTEARKKNSKYLCKHVVALLLLRVADHGDSCPFSEYCAEFGSRRTRVRDAAQDAAAKKAKKKPNCKGAYETTAKHNPTEWTTQGDFVVEKIFSCQPILGKDKSVLQFQLRTLGQFDVENVLDTKDKYRFLVRWGTYMKNGREKREKKMSLEWVDGKHLDGDAALMTFLQQRAAMQYFGLKRQFS
jgi:hypothetical protein